MAEDSGAFKTIPANAVPLRQFVITSPSLHGSLTPPEKCSAAVAGRINAAI
jgi:hypothetical protein